MGVEQGQCRKWLALYDINHDVGIQQKLQKQKLSRSAWPWVARSGKKSSGTEESSKKETVPGVFKGSNDALQAPRPHVDALHKAG